VRRRWCEPAAVPWHASGGARRVPLHKELKPEGIAELNEAGRQLARVLADEVLYTIDQLAPPADGDEGRTDVG